VASGCLKVFSQAGCAMVSPNTSPGLQVIYYDKSCLITEDGFRSRGKAIPGLRYGDVKAL
jgi:hypothetical protein